MTSNNKIGEKKSAIDLECVTMETIIGAFVGYLIYFFPQ
jgi:hypothetical protein